MNHPLSGSTPRFAPLQRLTRAAAVWSALSLALTTAADTLYLDGASSSGWDSLASWSTAPGAAIPNPPAVPGAADTVVFNIAPVNGPVVLNLNAGQSADSLVFNNTGTTALRGGGTNRTLSPGTGGITVNSGAGAVTIGSTTAGQAVSLVLGASQSWINHSASTLTFANSVTGAVNSTQTLTIGGSGNTTLTGILNEGSNGTLNLVKIGTGYLRLAGSSTNLVGTLDIQAGTVGITNIFTSTGLTGSGVLENASASNRFVFFNIADPDDQTFSGVIRNGSGSTPGQLGIVMNGPGTLTLTNNANNPRANLTVNAGRLILASTGTYGAEQQGATATNLTAFVGNTAGADGVLEIRGATVNYNNRSDSANEFWRSTLSIGANGTGAGALLFTAGTLFTHRQLGVGTADGAFGSFTQTGGDMNLSGGTFTVHTTGDNGLRVGESGEGILTLSGNAVLTLAPGNDGIELGCNATGSGVCNLLGGTVTVDRICGGGGDSTLNLNGGTLVANGDSAAFLADLDAAYVHAGGATIDNAGHDITIDQDLLAPDDLGVSAEGLTVTGTGFIAPPVVRIIGGSGKGATAVANVDANGNLTGITLTNPGSGYLDGDVLVIYLLGGGSDADSELIGAFNFIVRPSGGIDLFGNGTTTLTGHSTYTGPTLVAEGTLNVTGTLFSDVTVTTGSTLTGNGSCLAAATIAGVLLPGNSPGRMTIGRDLTLAATSTTRLELAGPGGVAGTDSDQLVVGGSLHFGGALEIVAFGGFDLAQTAVYDLWDSATSTGDFTSVSVAGVSLADGGAFWTGLIGGIRYTLDLAGGILTATVVTGPPPAPIGLAAVPGNAVVTLAWSPLADVTGYSVQRATAGGGFVELATGLSSPGYTDTTVLNGTTYTYTVTATNAAGASPSSVAVHASPASPAFTESELRPPAITRTGADLVLTTTTSVVGHTYRLQTTNDLVAGSWENSGAPLPGDGGALEFSLPFNPAEPRRFFRVLITR